jgi:hypothetical protein
MYWELMLIDEARAYIVAERKLAERFAEDMKTATDACDVDISFIGGVFQ